MDAGCKLLQHHQGPAAELGVPVAGARFLRLGRAGLVHFIPVLATGPGPLSGGLCALVSGDCAGVHSFGLHALLLLSLLWMHLVNY